MRKNISMRVAVLVAGIAILGGCGGGDAEGADDRDLALVGGAGGGDVAIGDTARGAAAGGAVRSGGVRAPSTGTIPGGTSILLASASRVCTNTHKVGDIFQATLSAGVTGSNGAVIPAGATALVQVTSVERKGNGRDGVEMGFVVQSIRVGSRDVPLESKISALQTEQVRSGDSKDAQKIVGGAVIGAVLGQVIGKDTRSTVIGAATGAAAGTVVAMTTGAYDACIPEKGTITIELTAPLTVPL